MQGAPNSHGDLHAPELRRGEDKGEPRSVKGGGGDLNQKGNSIILEKNVANSKKNY